MAAPLIYGHNSCFVSYSCNPKFKVSNIGGTCSSSSSPFDRFRISFHFCNFSGLNALWRNSSFRVQAMGTTQRNVAAPNNVAKFNCGPDHLLVLVHGILASPSDWTYVEAELKKRLGNNFLIHASSSNTYTKTFGGIDGAGRRLADEVIQVVKKTESLKRISFLAHSLGGLFARYAIAVLYSSNDLTCGELDDISTAQKENSEKSACSRKGLIAGLEPINFITLATPHLGVRGKKQLPFLLGVPLLEKLAPPIAPILIGRTGRQLFLTDGKPSKPPVLLRMASNCEEGKFISALGAFRCRILYANVSYDRIQMLINNSKIYFLAVCFKLSSDFFFLYHFLEHPSDMVGWRTSSIRRESELVKPPRRSLDGYKHVVDVEYCPPVSLSGPNFPPEAVKAKEAAQIEPTNQHRAEYHDILEEEMIHGLQRVGWRKVDVSFHSAFWPFFAHNNIHVKQEWLHNAGAGVIAHVADSLKQQESCTFIAASL